MWKKMKHYHKVQITWLWLTQGVVVGDLPLLRLLFITTLGSTFVSLYFFVILVVTMKNSFGDIG